MILVMSPDICRQHTERSASTKAEKIAVLGGCTFGLHWSEIVLAPESIHQNMNFSGYPIGGLDFQTIVFGTIESVCKAQRTYFEKSQGAATTFPTEGN